MSMGTGERGPNSGPPYWQFPYPQMGTWNRSTADIDDIIEDIMCNIRKWRQNATVAIKRQNTVKKVSPKDNPHPQLLVQS